MHRKRIGIMALCFLLMLCFTVVSTSPAYAARKKISVTKFESSYTVYNRDGTHYDIGIGAADMLTTELFKNKNYEVIERQQLAEILKEQRLGATGAVDVGTAAQLGQLIGLNYIVYGKIVSAGAEKDNRDFGYFNLSKMTVKVTVAVRMIDANTGAVVMAHQATGSIKKQGGSFEDKSGKQYGREVRVSADVYDEALRKAIGEIAGKINDLNPTEGTVVEIIGRDIYLDVGIDNGIEKGARFRIYREGIPIRNSSGQIIGVRKTDVCTIRVKSVEGNMSICEIEGDKMPVVYKNDRARLL